MYHDVRTRQPPTEKLHQIMARTAIFVSEHGGQSEIVLRVKQGDNPTFGFLMPDHHLHAYFQYLVDHPQILRRYTDSPKAEEEKSNNHVSEAGALSLLGSVYGTGDDDDATLQTEIKETEPFNLASVGNATTPMKLEIGEPPIGNKEAIKRPFSTGAKEKPLLVKKNFSGNVSTIARIKQTGEDSHSLTTEKAQSSQKVTADLKPSILEPPCFLKRTIEKIVEFIVRNGKQFEAILIEQDKNIGRFPFLLSTNQYHSYYLKIFEEAHELKLQGKNLFDQKNDAEHHGGNKKRVESKGKDANVDRQDLLAELSEGGYYDPQRKEKFKMVLSGQKKDSQDQQSKAAKQAGLSADEAAAAVLVATRGASPANTLHKKSNDDTRHTSKNSGATAEEAAAIVMAATRGRSPANAPQNMPRDDGRSSSFGSLQRNKPISNLASNGISGISVPAGLSGSTAQSDKKNCHSTTSDVSVATVIAKTVALAASREADSSEAGLTKEQKLKAERLKRAKMFATLIKSGNSCIGELVNSVSNRSGSMEPSTGGSMQMSTDSKVVGIEREGSSVPFDAEDLGRDHESRKRHHSRSSGYHEDSDEDHKHTRKKRHSSHDKDEQMFRKSRSSKDKEARHRHKHHSSSEDEHRHRRSYEHSHRHRNYDDSLDGKDRERSEMRRRKHHSHLDRKRESEAGDSLKSIEHSEGPSVTSTGVSDRRDISASEDKLPSDAAEIPNDLRVKIRAMLLENL